MKAKHIIPIWWLIQLCFFGLKIGGFEKSFYLCNGYYK